MQEEYSNEQEQWRMQLDVYLQKLHVEAHEREAAVGLAAVEQQQLEQKLWEVCAGLYVRVQVHEVKVAGVMQQGAFR